MTNLMLHAWINYKSTNPINGGHSFKTAKFYLHRFRNFLNTYQ